jgi:hypothetical protein
MTKYYLETTMFNYYSDRDRDGHLSTFSFFGAIGRGLYDCFTSEYVVNELKNAPDPKQTNMLSLLDKYSIPILFNNDETINLANIC